MPSLKADEIKDVTSNSALYIRFSISIVDLRNLVLYMCCYLVASSKLYEKIQSF